MRMRAGVWSRAENIGEESRDMELSWAVLGKGKLEADDVDWLSGSGGVWGRGGVDCGG